MMDEPQRRLLIPAPVDTRREAQIDWYEARIYPEHKTVHLVACNEDAVEVGRAEMQWIRNNRVTGVISDERMRVAVDFSFGTNGSDVVDMRGTINDQEFEFARQTANAESVDVKRKPDLDAAETSLLGTWGRLSDPLLSLARATQATLGEAHNSWGCTSCILGAAGTGLFAGCCVISVGCCGGALLGAATVIHECAGAQDPCGH